jgi:hypothetical protein
MRDLVAKVRQHLRLKQGRYGHVHNYEVDPETASHLSSSDIGRIYFSHEGKPIHKWVHYLDAYDRHFAPFRGKPTRFLEIGVWKGGSLELWRKYLGPEARILGIDVNPACAAENVRIGSQDDPGFLKQVVEELGGIDIVLDDGSHVGKHQRASFQTLWPLLEDGGLYAIEDLHTSYWPGEFEGGYRRRGTGVELVKELMDDLHGWWHDRRAPLRDTISAIHVYDSIAILEKKRRGHPVTTKVGRAES